MDGESSQPANVNAAAIAAMRQRSTRRAIKRALD
jgi:hypothetical protein